MQANRWIAAAILTFALTNLAAAQNRPPGVPEPGKSERIDAIIKRGTLKVGITPAFPWVYRNKSGTGDEWRGSSWTFAKATAEALGVKLEVVPVSNETKVPIVISGGVDITIAALAETDARKQVVDFVTYSTGTFCIFGLKTNPKAAVFKQRGQAQRSGPDLCCLCRHQPGCVDPADVPEGEDARRHRQRAGAGR